MIDFIAKAKKAIWAFASSAVVAYLAANEDGKITEAEWVLIAGSLVVGAVTYALRNRPKPEGVQARSGPAPY
jgi:hypothetical protein